MNVTTRQKLFSLIFLMLLFIPTLPSFSQTQFEVTPSMTVMQEHDDNIYLDPGNEISSYITMVSPSLRLSLLKQHTQLGLEYTPTFVWYSEDDVDNTVRHSGTLTFGQDLTEYLHLDLTDSVLRSDDPLEDTEAVEGVRDTRDQYLRNTAKTSLIYSFGQGNILTVGYRHGYLKNDSDDDDDGRTQDPFVSLTYRLDIKKSLEINYTYNIADFWNDGIIDAGDDYTGHSAGLRYIHSFTTKSSVNAGYFFTTRNFEGNEEDYNIHNGLIGFDQAFSPDFSFSTQAGYFIQENKQTSDEKGFSYYAALNKQIERGFISLGGSGGWDEAYLEAERRGFTRYWSANTSVEYQILEPLTGYANGIYRHDKDKTNRRWDIFQGSCGLRWAFHRWISLSLNYTYAEKNDDSDTEDYITNRVTLLLSASKPYRW